MKHVYLDLARGLAALAVFAGHLRSFVFVDFADAADIGPAWKAFYFATGFGQQAVMIFFVLSGYLISRSVAQSVAAGDWSWGAYAIKRLIRLWIVLVPALLLTLFWDRLGLALTNSDFYSGALRDRYHSGPELRAGESIFTLRTFLCNILFLQTIAAPTYGSNGPLWSLANEFWYYVIFPLLAVAFLSRSATLLTRGALLVAAIGLCWFLPAGLVLYGLIWLVGYGVYLAESVVRASKSATWAALTIGLASLGASLVAARTSSLSSIGADFAVGLSFGLLLLALVQVKPGKGIAVGITRLLARFSYTLYLVHFPVAAFLACYLMQGERLHPTGYSAAIYAAFAAGILLYSFGIYFAFERNTERAQRRLLQLAGRKFSPP